MGMGVVCCGGCFCGLGVGVRSLLVFFFQNLVQKFISKNKKWSKMITKNKKASVNDDEK
jgi:hypothetical protein